MKDTFISLPAEKLMEKKRIRRKQHLIKPKFQLKYTGFNLIVGFVLLMVFCGIAFAHTPYLLISDNEDGQDVRVKDVETAETSETGDDKKSGALTVTPVTRIYPLQDDFEYVKDIIPDPLMIQDPNGVIRVIPIMQGYRYHHGSGLEKLIEKVEAKRREGIKVDFAINDVGLCFGVTSGYLSLKFAISELYGEAIPKADDFKIMAKGRMCSGVLDMYSLYFGRKMGNQSIQGSAEKGLTFIAERPSTEERIVFKYNLKTFPELDRFFLVKNNPEKFKDVDFGSLKREVIKKLFSINDFSYFKVISKG